MTTEILNFGCRLNIFEGEIIRGHAASHDHGVIINSCAVTQAAERDARRAIARIHRTRPGTAITVTGCAAQIAPAKWAALPGVTRVLGNLDKLHPASWAPGATAQVTDIMGQRQMPAQPVTEFAGRSRAFLAVQQGCDHRCSFCIIPFGRGPSRSVPLDQAARQCQALLDAGYQEIVLTGVDIASYGGDLPGRPTLAALLRHVLRTVPRLPRLRCSSLDPAALGDDFFALLAGEPRLMPHLHLSLQAGSSLILKRMKRRHSAEQAAAIIAKARAARPGIAIGADLITGFPTETEALFNETAAFIASHTPHYLHVFPYSERPGTPAARMPAVPLPERRLRAATLRALGQSHAAAFFAAQTGQTRQILTEIGGGGHTEHFAPVRLTSPCPAGILVQARIISADSAGLLAEV